MSGPEPTMRRHAAWTLACALVPLAGLLVAPPAGAQEPGPAGGEVAPTTSRDALLARVRAFEEADRSFNLLRLELTEDWAQLLLAALDRPSDEPGARGLQNAAFTCLKRISGQDLPQTRNAWERWWKSTWEVTGD